jgi:hypothetical protein
MRSEESENAIHVESGRLVLVPKRRKPRGPMSDVCEVVPVPAGKLYVTPYYVQVAGHPGTAGLRRVTITRRRPPGAPVVHEVLAHAPFMVIGDQSFVYPRSPGPMSEAGRSLRACEGARRSGTFRADSFDVGVCLRTGWKRGLVELRPTEDGFACEFEPQEQDDASAA